MGRAGQKETGSGELPALTLETNLELDLGVTNANPGSHQKAFVALGIDPGPIDSGFCVIEIKGFRILNSGVAANLEVRDLIIRHPPGTIVGCEVITPRGKNIGHETIDTAIWCGRFIEACAGTFKPFHRTTHNKLGQYWCGDWNATDSRIWQAMIDLWDKPGTKDSPGKLYGVRKHARIAVAVVGCVLNAMNQ